MAATTQGPGYYLLRLAATALVGCCIFALARWATESTALEQRFDDVLSRVLPAGTADPALVVVGIDQAAIDAHGSWPFASEKVVALAEALVAQGARAVVFVDPVLGSDATAAQVHRLRALQDRALVAIPRMVRIDPFDVQRLHLVGTSESGADRLRNGIALIEPDADGVVRRLALAHAVGGEAHPALALSVAAALGAEDLPQPQVDRTLSIHFSVAPRGLATVSAATVLAGQLGAAATSLKEAVCLVGLIEPGLIGTLTTPRSDPPLYAAPVEIHAAALDTLRSGRHGPIVPGWLLLVAAALITVWLTLTYRLLRPLGILVLMAVYVLLLPVIGAAIQGWLHCDVPVLAFIILGVTALLGSLLVQLIRYQDDLLSLLTVLQRTHWLLPADFDRRALSQEALASLAGAIGELIHARGIIVARTGRGLREGKKLTVLAVAGFATDASRPEKAPALGAQLEAVPVDEVAVIDGDLLFPGLAGRLWAVPIRGGGRTAGWLLARMDDMTRLRQSEQTIQGLTRHLLGLVDPREAGGRWRLPDLAILRLLRTHYLSDVTDRLEALQERDRREREIMTLMLDVTRVGLVLADSMGRVLFRNKFCEQALAETKLLWNGESAIELLRMIAGRQKAEADRRLVDCFRAGKGRTFTLTPPAGAGAQADTYMVQVWPFLHDPGQSDDEEVGFRSITGGETLTIGRMPSWPDHMIIAVANVTAFHHVDKLKSELIEMIAFKCRNHMSSILVCSDLLKSEPHLVGEVVPELRRTAASLDTIFEQFRASAQFGIDYQTLDQPVPLNLRRVVVESLTALRHLADSQDVAFDLSKQELQESAYVAEGPLRRALVDLVQACLHATRPKQVITITLAEGAAANRMLRGDLVGARTAIDRAAVQADGAVTSTTVHTTAAFAAGGSLVIDLALPECTLLVALKRFPVAHLEGQEEYSSLFSAGPLPVGDLSIQAAALMPDVHRALRGAGCRFRAYAIGEVGVGFRIGVPVLG